MINTELIRRIDELGDLRLKIEDLAGQEWALAGQVRTGMEKAGLERAASPRFLAQLLELVSLSVDPDDLRPLAQSQGQWITWLKVDLARARAAVGQEALEKIGKRRKIRWLEVDPIKPELPATS
jgi:hypothetical protein